eukprot:2171046-Pyramimonas_sp.AAC.1
MLLASNSYIGWRWVPSESNAADAASRGRAGFPIQCCAESSCSTRARRARGPPRWLPRRQP